MCVCICSGWKGNGRIVSLCTLFLWDSLTRLVAGKRELGDSSVSTAGLWLQEQAATHSFQCEQCGFGLSSSCLYCEYSYPLSHPSARKLLFLITQIDYILFFSWSLKQLRLASNSLCNYRWTWTLDYSASTSQDAEGTWADAGRGGQRGTEWGIGAQKWVRFSTEPPGFLNSAAEAKVPTVWGNPFEESLGLSRPR